VYRTCVSNCLTKGSASTQSGEAAGRYLALVHPALVWKPSTAAIQGRAAPSHEDGTKRTCTHFREQLPGLGRQPHICQVATAQQHSQSHRCCQSARAEKKQRVGYGQTHRTRSSRRRQTQHKPRRGHENTSARTESAGNFIDKLVHRRLGERYLLGCAHARPGQGMQCATHKKKTT